MPAICGRNSSESLRQSEILHSIEGLIMKRCLLITALVALPLFVTSSVVAQEDTPVFGKVTTNKKTALKAAPNAHAAAAATVDANTDLRWVMGDRNEASRIWQESLKSAPDNETLLETIKRLKK